jgi:hypothetical protein
MVSMLQPTARGVVCGLVTGLLLGFVRVPHSHAASWTVCATGCQFTTVQAAIYAAANGDTITILDPVHAEGGIRVYRNVTITGSGATIVQPGRTGQRWQRLCGPRPARHHPAAGW